jgi:hypothetical protein
VKASEARKPASSRARSSALGSRTKMGGCIPAKCEAAPAHTRGPSRMHMGQRAPASLPDPDTRLGHANIRLGTVRVWAHSLTAGPAK